MRTVAAILLTMLLVPAGVRAQAVYIDNVVIVLDSSGSMNQKMSGTSVRKLDAARNAIKDVVRTIPPTTQIGVLVFGSRANGWIYPLGPRNDAALFAAVDALKADGGTPLGAYMKTGADRLLQARASQYGYGSYRLLVVTDGEAGDRHLVERYTPDIMARGIVTDVIGVDMATDHTLATKVHSYRRADDPAALGRALREVFAEVGKTGGSDTGDDAFAELAGLPDAAAVAIIGALSNSGNHPVGETPPAPASPAVAAAPPRAPAAPPSVPSPSPPSPPIPQSKPAPSPFRVLLVTIVAILVLRSFFQRRRQ